LLFKIVPSPLLEPMRLFGVWIALGRTADDFGPLTAAKQPSVAP
jgi:hypothetical protein